MKAGFLTSTVVLTRAWCGVPVEVDAWTGSIAGRLVAGVNRLARVRQPTGSAHRRTAGHRIDSVGSKAR
jgi:hypothetical protein